MKEADDAVKESRFYVIFRELARTVDAPEGALELQDAELDEIDRLRRIVMEVSEERPSFLTST
jgi:hypothetical protein